ncbi:hypothetical protein Hypma_001832 [Hypsizygus marmoreus]|uniref:Uncharacterized protein n=1 Tax=Hypsizygus marmoreus TaxID=39966 RepID=A0A369J7I9_HYPMA|nr:hypothetical protein Hypma_001832 [Hypsizygus marmoreus]
MPVFRSQHPSALALLPSSPAAHPYGRPKERDVDRAILLDVAPDRESLFLSNKSTEELRQLLKIRASPNTGHWLYRTRKRTKANLQDGTTRISTFVQKDSPEHSSISDIHVLRRVLSTSSMAPLPHPMRAETRPLAHQEVDIWGTMTLSTTDRLISPRPLGPTHIVIVHSSTEPSTFHSVALSGRTLRRKKSSPLVNVVELPINDLLFVLNVPNLGRALPILPPRLHKELPRVVMYVPHLETFPELVVYLHTRNQAELFRKLVPEWIRDLMHPFPEIPDFNVAGSQLFSLSETRSITRVPRQLLGMLVPGSGSNSSLDSISSYGSFPNILEYKRTAKSVAEEIADAAQALEYEVDPLLRTVAMLNALRDNLDHIGYFGKDLWNELDIYRHILIRAVSFMARITGEEEVDD